MKRAAGAAAGQPHVLLVQENHLVRRGLAGLLLAAGYAVTAADERQGVLEVAREGRFDLAIVAVYRGSRREVTDAVTLLRRREPPVPVLVSADPGVFRDLAATGARRIVVRPPATLLDLVAQALRA